MCVCGQGLWCLRRAHVPWVFDGGACACWQAAEGEATRGLCGRGALGSSSLLRFCWGKRWGECHCPPSSLTAGTAVVVCVWSLLCPQSVTVVTTWTVQAQLRGLLSVG